MANPAKCKSVAGSHKTWSEDAWETRVCAACGVRITLGSSALRADDHAILEMCQRETGVGRLTMHQPYPSAIRNARPQTRWAVRGREGTLRMIEIFEKYPLRSKKARDFNIWKEAVRFWVSSSRTPGQPFADDYYETMAAYKAELARIREYEVLGADVAVLPKVERPPALWEEAA